MDRSAMANEVLLRSDILLQRRVDLVEIDICNKAIDTGIDAGGLRSVDVAVGGNGVGQDFEIGEAARVSRVRREPANALEVIALKIVLARFAQAFLREGRLLAHEGAAERRPKAFVLPA